MLPALLRVASVPSDVMTETNCVYIHPDESNPKQAHYLLINGFPLTLKTDPMISRGILATNSIQRRCCGLSTSADRIDLGAVAFTPTGAVIAACHVEVEYIASSKKGGTLDCKEFTAYFLKQFDSQYFAEGQQLGVIIDPSAKYIVTMNKVEAIVGKSGELAKIGQLNSEATKLFIAVKDKCEIQLVNISDVQMDSQQQTVINPFNLEKLGIGGLRAEFGQVFRRAFASRIFPRSLIKRLGMTHVKGVLLFGPPGTGKTLIARKIGEILNCRPPKIVNGPEVFNKYVGQTEENVRKLFAEAEADQASKGEQSPLHLIIFDEFDAICKQRGAVRDGTGVGDNVVNQLLSKIDGVNALNNVLLIGMTNRKDLLDEAILRPGRFEVHVEIGLPDETGRVEIFRIHTRGMRESNVMSDEVNLEELASLTKNYSGAEIEGVARAAISHAFSRHIDFENPSETIDPEKVKVTRQDFMNALNDVVPAFGQAKDECQALMRQGIIDYGPVWKHIELQCTRFVDHLKESSSTRCLSVLMEGCMGCGKSAVAAHCAMGSGFPYVKLLSADTLVGYSEMQKCNIVRKAFEDAYKSPNSVLVLDDIERLIEYSHLGARYSNVLLQTLLVLVRRPPPTDRKLLILGTTSLPDVMESLEVTGCFSVSISIPTVDASQIPAIAGGLNIECNPPEDMEKCVEIAPLSLPIKKLILLLEMATKRSDTGEGKMTFESFTSVLRGAGVLELRST